MPKSVVELLYLEGGSIGCSFLYSVSRIRSTGVRSVEGFVLVESERERNGR